MKIIIAGSRKFNNYGFLKSKCDNIINFRTDIEIVSGCCRGADLLGEKYAFDRGYPVKPFPAKWKRPDGSIDYSAGFIRNEQMAKYANGLIAFWDMKSPGTKNMIDLANKYSLKVRIIDVSAVN
jgi:hypothetical protein